ncbi:PRC-barrel domain-containing protein [Acidisoma sp. L85]|uniref:PRC-barrel domain-containing protein n=1 Tax=Acidisoma sp. L85 TaxID=1641850 RepID=UPI00131DC667|nr:PRC-barrel domain-containing protein [Acidisoma sp. L85]
MVSDENPSNTGGRLIAASKVNGTAVYNTAGESLGSVHDVMLDKASGKADYAILSFGGFLGIGERYHPLPWNQLTYDPQAGGFVVNLDRSRLEGAPTYAADDLSLWDERRSADIDTYYGASPGIGPAPGLGDAGLGIGGAVR